MTSNKTFIFISLLIFFGLGFFVSTSFFKERTISFEDLSPKKMQQRIIKERNHAIRKAKERGDYRCCIEPPCTMCYMEENEWNNFTPGTCACDDLIAEGKKPCPQCKNGLCSSQENSAFCEPPSK